MPEMDKILIVIVIVSVSVISAEMESINATGIDFTQNGRYMCLKCCLFQGIPLVEFMYLVFTRMPDESYRR